MTQNLLQISKTIKHNRVTELSWENDSIDVTDVPKSFPERINSS